MGSGSGHICRACGTKFQVQDGGGFYFDMLHCDTCGNAHSVSHASLDDIHLGFVKGLGRPYATVRADMDRRIQRDYAGETLSRGDYHAAAEATVDPCLCGGPFRYDAPARCPNCRSTSELWESDPKAAYVLYD
jgi:hypothetical protein